jgi:tetratricopeptide (TPR) repeat protein
MRNLVACRFGVLLLAAWLGACSSSTVIRSNPPGAKVYLDGEYAGQTPLEISDRKVSLSTTSVRLEMDGYAPTDYILQKNESLDLFAAVGTIFFLIPILWILDYDDEHHYTLLAEGSAPTGAGSGIQVTEGPRGLTPMAPPPRGGTPPTATTPVGATSTSGADPQLADSLNDEGTAFYSGKDYPAAANKFRAAIAASPEARFYYNLCSALDRMGQVDEALQACGAVYTHAPSDDLRLRTDGRVKTIRAKKK